MNRFWACAGISLAGLMLFGQTPRAREIFYGEDRPINAKTPAPARKKALSRPKGVSSPQLSRDESGTAQRVSPSAPSLQSVSANRASARPLGLKYTVLKRDPSAGYFEVDRDSVFAEGDQLRVIVETNDSGYLYVVNQGTSHVWMPVFPTKEMKPDSNRVEPGQKYQVPAGQGAVIGIHSPPGTEKLFVVLSRQPLATEELIYSLDNRQRNDAQPPRALLAQTFGPLDDNVVERLRKSYSRDLIIEKVDDSAIKGAGANPSRPPEKAVYVVVDPNAGENSRVVADIDLRHE